MRNSLRSVTVLLTTIVVSMLVAVPAMATEAPDEKWNVFTRSAHSMVGGFILLVCALMVGLAVANAISQLRGKRSQADGKFRWR